MSIILFLYLFVVSAFAYSIPDPDLEIIKPKGVRISIPHEYGIDKVAFVMSVDDPIGSDPMKLHVVELKDPLNGRFVYENIIDSVNSNSKIYYIIKVIHRNDTYRKVGLGTPLAANTSDSTIDVPTSTSSPIDKPTLDCEPSKTTVKQKVVCKGELIFEDNFDNLNLAKWQREVRLPMDEDDAEFVSYQARDENCYTDSGQLHIVPSLLNQLPGFERNIRNGILDFGAECTGINDRRRECRRRAQRYQILPPVVSARIQTKDFFSFRYGKVEVRAKLPKGDWLFPLILLEPKHNLYGVTGYKSGQMRVAFIRGNEELEDAAGNDISGHRIMGGVVLAAGERLRDIFLRGSVQKSHLGNDFHTYTLTWTENLITLEIDGIVYANVGGNFASRPNLPAHAISWKRGDIMAPFDKEFYLTLGVSVGGHSDFPDSVGQTIKPWRNKDPKAELKFWNRHADWYSTWKGSNIGLHVDYVRVYAL